MTNMNMNYKSFQMNPPSSGHPGHSNPGKYKTMICKHFQTPKGCSFGEKCQFAHGQEDLRGSNGLMPPMGMNQPMMEQKKGPNPQNYKIVKCKYWEKDGTCRYGSLCTFAHGDKEIRTKSQNVSYNKSEPMEPNPMQSPNPYSAMPGMNPYMMGFNPNMLMAMQGMMEGYQQDPQQMNNFFMNYAQMQPMMGMGGQGLPGMQGQGMGGQGLAGMQGQGMGMNPLDMPLLDDNEDNS